MKGIRRIGVFDTKKEAASGRDTSLEKADKTGYLLTFSSKTFLGREKWKKRYYVLTGNKLYRFVKKEDASLDLRCASRRRLIILDSYDICQLVNESECKREHVFLLDGANSSIEQPKYVFAADTKEDMLDWMSRLRKAILGGGPRGSGRPQRPPRTKPSSLHISSSVKSDGDASSEPPTPTRLYNPTKYRVRGPRGRRLPQKKNRQLRDANDKFISNSLCELDGSLSDEEIVPKSSALRRSGAHSPPLGDRAKSNSSGHLAYQYSSSDDSLLWKECAKKPPQEEGKSTTTDHKKKKKKEEEETEESTTSKQEGSAKDKDNDEVRTYPMETILVQEEEPSKALPKKGVPAPAAPPKPSSKQAETDVEAGRGLDHDLHDQPPKQSVGPLIYLSAKLLEMSGCLDRFQRHAKEELDAVKTHLADVKRRLLEDPPGSTQTDIVARKACVIMTVAFLACLLGGALFVLFLLNGFREMTGANTALTPLPPPFPGSMNKPPNF